MELIKNSKPFFALALCIFLQGPLYGSETAQFLTSIRYATDRLFPLFTFAPSIEVSGDSCLVTLDANAAGPLLEWRDLAGGATQIKSVALGDLDGFLKEIALDTILFLPCLSGGNQERSFFLQFRYSNRQGIRLPQTRTIIFDGYLANRIQTAWFDAILSGKKGVKVTLLPSTTISGINAGYGVRGRERVEYEEEPVSAEKIIPRGAPLSPHQNGHGSQNPAIGLTESETGASAGKPRNVHGNRQGREQNSTAAPLPNRAEPLPLILTNKQDAVLEPYRNSNQSEGFGEGYGPTQNGPCEGERQYVMQ